MVKIGCVAVIFFSQLALATNVVPQVASTIEDDATFALKSQDTDYAFTPGGALRHKSCIYSVPDGATIAGSKVMLNGKVLFTKQPCAFKTYRPTYQNPPGSGPGDASSHWMESLLAVPPAGSQFSVVNSITAAQTVPPNPSNMGDNGQCIYAFIGLVQSTGHNTDEIVQPVLSWGNGCAQGGGHHWSMTNWHCDDGHLFGTCDHGPEFTNPKAGFGLSVQVKETSTNVWTATFIGLGSGPGSPSLSWTAGAPMVLGVPGAMELFNINDCNELPPTFGWTQIQVSTQTPTGDPNIVNNFLNSPFQAHHLVSQSGVIACGYNDPNNFNTGNNQNSDFF